MKIADLGNLYQTIGQLGPCGLTIMLDSEDNKSPVAWHIINDNKGNTIGAFKKVMMKNLGLIFYVGLNSNKKIVIDIIIIKVNSGLFNFLYITLDFIHY